MKTLIQQYKDDIYPIIRKPVPKEIEFVNQMAIDLIKQAYINSIDCQIEWLMKKGKVHSARNDEYPDPCELAYSEAIIEVIEYLKQQRELIEKEK